jgi:hypothetical protein
MGLKYRVKNPMEALPGLNLAHGNSPRLGPRIQEEPPPWGSFPNVKSYFKFKSLTKL